MLGDKVVNIDLFDTQCFSKSIGSLHAPSKWRSLNDDFVILDIVLGDVLFHVFSHDFGLLKSSRWKWWVLLNFVSWIDFVYPISSFCMSNQCTEMMTRKVFGVMDNDFSILVSLGRRWLLFGKELIELISLRHSGTSSHFGNGQECSLTSELHGLLLRFSLKDSYSIGACKRISGTSGIN